MTTKDGGRWTEVLPPFVLCPLSLVLLPSSVFRPPSSLAHSQSAPPHPPRSAAGLRCPRIELGIPVRGAWARSPTLNQFHARARRSRPSPPHGSEGRRGVPR